jgi:hypothetical protein
MSYSLQESAGAVASTGPAITEEAMLRWLAAAGVDTAKPVVREEARFILDQLPALKGDGATAAEPIANGGPFATHSNSLIHVAGTTPT